MSLVDGVAHPRRKIVTYGKNTRKHSLDVRDCTGPEADKTKRRHYTNKIPNHLPASHLGAQVEISTLMRTASSAHIARSDPSHARGDFAREPPETSRASPSNITDSSGLALRTPPRSENSDSASSPCTSSAAANDHRETKEPFSARCALEQCKPDRPSRNAHEPVHIAPARHGGPAARQATKPRRGRDSATKVASSQRHLAVHQTSLDRPTQVPGRDPVEESPISNCERATGRSTVVTEATPAKCSVHGCNGGSCSRSNDKPSSIPARSEEDTKTVQARPTPKGSPHGRSRNKLPARDGQPRATSICQRSANESQVISNRAKPPKVTYAAVSRTILKDVREDTIDMLPSIDSLGPSSGCSKRQLRLDGDEFSFTDGGSETNDLVGAGSGSLKSVRELRQAGMNARAERETEALLDDLDNTTLPARLQSLLFGLALKSQSEVFLALLSTGNALRIYTLWKRTVNRECRILLASAIVRILHSSPDVDLACFSSPSSAKSWTQMLSDTHDLIHVGKSPARNLSGTGEVDAKSLSSALLAAPVWRYKAPSRVTPRALALQCLDTILPRLHRTGSGKGLLSLDMARSLADVLAPPAPQLGPGADAGSQTLLALSILELSSQRAGQGNSRSRDRSVVTCLIRLVSLLRGQDSQVALQIWIATLRLLLNLANNEPETCDELSRAGTVGSISELTQSSFIEFSMSSWNDEQELKLDRLVLSLGVLINLAEHSILARIKLSQEQPGAAAPLVGLVDIFRSRLQDVFEVTFLHQDLCAHTNTYRSPRSKKQGSMLPLDTWQSYWLAYASTKGQNSGSLHPLKGAHFAPWS